MSTAAVFSPRDLLLCRRRLLFRSVASRSSNRVPCISPVRSSRPSRLASLVVASSAASFDGLDAKGKSHRSSRNNESILLNLIQDIEPLDVSVIQKDVPAETVDAMKRTISGMLGLLPSDQFHVVVEALWDPLFKLLVSSMMTGYTLRNAEYRLSFERNLDLAEEGSEDHKKENLEDNSLNYNSVERTHIFPEVSRKNNLVSDSDKKNEDMRGIEGLGDMSSQARDYIIKMQSRLNSMKRELHDLKRKNSALQMQQFVGEEKNDLLDYLRSLKPEKVAELSEPTCPGVQEAIHSVVHGLLATLSPKMQSRAPQSGKSPLKDETLNFGKKDDDCTELVENNTSIHFQPLISVPRDYLARLLFWCMLLGHYLRGLEYRLELMQLLTISGNNFGSVSNDSDFVS